jgi:hypothetical protein
MTVNPARPKGCRRDPGSLLAGQLKTLVGDRAAVSLQRERTWASITFTGTRHCLAVDWADTADLTEIRKFAATLPDHEFIIPGYFIADILVTKQSKTQLLVEALSIIDPVDNDHF